ncbi:MAG: hypothetical protein WCG95_00280 [bacterium]
MTIYTSNIVIQNFIQNQKKELPSNLRTQKMVSKNEMQFTSVASFAAKNYAIPLISFGSLNKQNLVTQVNKLVEKYSQGENPIIIKIKPDFISKLVGKIETNDSIILGVTGESASGKTFLLKVTENNFVKRNSKKLIALLQGDDFYYDTSQRIRTEGLEAMFKTGFSFDAPEAVELSRIKKVFEGLVNGKTIKVPSYDFSTGERTPNAKTVSPAKFILLDSIFALDKELEPLLTGGIFVKSSQQTMKKRFFERALTERKRTLEAAKLQFMNVTSKAKQHILPKEENADLILNGEADIDTINNFYRDLFAIVSGST